MGNFRSSSLAWVEESFLAMLEQRGLMGEWDLLKLAHAHAGDLLRDRKLRLIRKKRPTPMSPLTLTMWIFRCLSSS
jgi:hypothetical protein